MVTRKTMHKTLDYYLKLPWTYTIETAKESRKTIYIVHVNELPWVGTDAESLEEAMQLIKEAMAAAFELYIEEGEEIPEPKVEKEYKGNIAYRTTSRRHFMLAREAKKRNLSLSQIIDSLIDGAFVSKK